MANVLERKANVPPADVGNYRVTRRVSKRVFCGRDVTFCFEAADIPAPIEEKPFFQTIVGKALKSAGRYIVRYFDALKHYQYSRHIGELYKPYKE